MASQSPCKRDPLESLDAAARTILRMHERLGPKAFEFDAPARGRVAAEADAIADLACGYGWEDLRAYSIQISTLVRMSAETMSPILLKSRLGQIFFQMDRQIAEQKRRLAAVDGGECQAIATCPTSI